MAFEVPISVGFVDVVGKKEDRTVAVEVEVSGSQAEENIEKCVKAGFDEIHVLCASEFLRRNLEVFISEKGFIIVLIGLLRNECT